MIGAVIIMAGLYLVVWGKSKDHKSANQSPITDTKDSLTDNTTTTTDLQTIIIQPNGVPHKN